LIHENDQEPHCCAEARPMQQKITTRRRNFIVIPTYVKFGIKNKYDKRTLKNRET
jgi:hypothetical protein